MLNIEYSIFNYEVNGGCVRHFNIDY